MRRLGRVGAVVAAGGIAVLVLAGCAAMEPGAPTTDARQRLALGPAERDKVLAEMRGLLGSVSAVVQGLAAGDSARAEAAARASGMAVAVDVDPRLMQRLPPEFRRLGMQTHKGFDGLADRIKAGAAREQVLGALGALTANCVACHAAWRLDEAR